MRHAIRSLLRAREFSLVAVAIIAIGIGATTAVFSVVDAALLRPLPFRDSGRLFILSRSNPRRGVADGPFSYPAFVDLAARDRTLSGLAAFTPERFNATGTEQPEQLPGARVSASFFDVLGVDAAAGRTFRPSDDERGGAHVAVLGRRYWIRRFGARADAAGAVLTLNGAPHTVVGVLGIDLPPPFDDVDIWTTRVEELSGFTLPQIETGLGYLAAVARLAPGAPVSRAQAELDVIARGYAEAHPTNTDADANSTLRLAPLGERAVGAARPPLLLLMAAVGVVLLIACANVSNLVLVRAAGRAHEAAVRSALGATRWDLLRWQCAESLVLAAAGGAAGVLLAFWAVDLAASALEGLPRASAVAVNGRVLLFSFVVSLASGLVFGIVPSSPMSRHSPADALRSGGRGATRGGGGRGPLVAAEVALSIVLLVCAGLLLRSFERLTRVPVGFEPRGLLTVRVSLPTASYPDADAMRRFMAAVTPRLAAAPGVASAAATMALPPAITTMAPYQIGDRPTVPIGDRPVGQWSAVTPEYFATLGIPIVGGRAFDARDSERSPLVVVVSEGLAKRAWPNEPAIGRTILVGRFAGFADVVGVAGDVRNNGLAREPLPAMYTPYAQRPWPAMQFAIRTAGPDPMALAGEVRAAFRGVDADLPLTRVETMDAALAGSVATERLLAALLAAFAGVALLMAAAGVYGVIAYSVAQRAPEIGVRMALGADAGAVLRLVAREGLRFAAAGALAGTVLAAAAGRAMRTLLFDLSPADPLTYAAVLAVFAVVASAALVVPARRALRVDPAAALRAE